MKTRTRNCDEISNSIDWNGWYAVIVCAHSNFVKRILSALSSSQCYSVNVCTVLYAAFHSWVDEGGIEMQITQKKQINETEIENHENDEGVCNDVKCRHY